MHPALWLAFAIGSEIIATVSLKLSDGFSRPIPAVVVVLGYGFRMAPPEGIEPPTSALGRPRSIR